MRRYTCVLFLFVCLPAFGQGKWLRRATLAAACAASFWDYSTTRTAVANGAVESNRFLAGANGQPRWRLMLGLKTGLCAGMAVLQEKPMFGRRMDLTWTGLNTGLAAYYSTAALHNRKLAAPAYLKRAPE